MMSLEAAIKQDTHGVIGSELWILKVVEKNLNHAANSCSAAVQLSEQRTLRGVRGAEKETEVF